MSEAIPRQAEKAGPGTVPGFVMWIPVSLRLNGTQLKPETSLVPSTIYRWQLLSTHPYLLVIKSSTDFNHMLISLQNSTRILIISTRRGTGIKLGMSSVSFTIFSWDWTNSHPHLSDITMSTKTNDLWFLLIPPKITRIPITSTPRGTHINPEMSLVSFMIYSWDRTGNHPYPLDLTTSTGTNSFQ